MKILIYPYDKNPYQGLLYEAMRKQYGNSIKITYSYFLPILGAAHLPLELLVRRLLGYKIIHIHWVAFYVRQRITRQKQLSWYLTVLQLWWMKKLGYKIIWTVHDITPHQQETIDDMGIARYLAKIATVKIIHSNFTREQLQQQKVNSNNCVLIPHGNYDGIYDNAINREEARKQLNISNDAQVVLFFGIVKAYKGINELLKAYKIVSTSNTVLLIAGKCSDPELTSAIQIAAQEENIKFYNKYIPDNDVATFFKSADVVCLPFKAVTTSGSTLLALTFGKPLIAPLQGSLKDIPKNVGYLYPPQQKDALVISLRKSLKKGNDMGSMAKASRQQADNLTWSKIATQTYRIYENLYEQ